MPLETTSRYGTINPSLYLLVADMRADDSLKPAGAGFVCFLTGGAVAYDNTPGGYYIWNPTSVAADNNGTVIKITSVTTGRWIGGFG